ncbi:ABC transporter permease subunit [Streptomyces sp. NPDC087440]|uniref:ABC transporter permease subunit n=1 Tax=Streptomyces sp. NPDC087440 TaxID=3365790 RepID=UPI0037F70529
MTMTPETLSSAPAAPPVRRGGSGFGRVLHAEWTKFRTVRGWVLGTFGALVAVCLVGLLATAQTAQGGGRTAGLPVGPGGGAVNDSFSFLHQPLKGDGTLTVPVTSLTGRIATTPTADRPGLAPWAKAGIIVKDSLTPGSSYAAVMVTGEHGVRMQDDFTHDTAGPQGTSAASPASAGGAPRWLRLKRAGDTVTGYRSTDGRTWSEVGTARLSGLAETAQVGLFVTSPSATEGTGTGTGFVPAVAIAVFGAPVLGGQWRGEAGQHRQEGDGWQHRQVGDGAGTSGSYTGATKPQAVAVGAGYRITGAGDIAPVVGGPAGSGVRIVSNFLVGAFAGLIMLVVVATGYTTVEYRRGLIGVTFAATPGRRRVLGAKAVVVGGTAFLVGTVAAAVMVPFGAARSAAGGFPVLTVPTATELRVILGTGLLLAAASVLALAVGAILRRSAVTITVVVAGLVLPYLLASASLLPQEASDWLLTVTPAAGFAIQQSVEHYDQVVTVYSPMHGYFPLPPWAGLGVLCAYAAAAFGVALVRVHRRDA